MSEYLVRRLLVDLKQPFERHWAGGDVFRSAFFNAFSMGLPLGEQFFIEATREAVDALPHDQQERFEPELRGFVGQEATHRYVHSLCNRQLERRHGYVNTWPGHYQKLRHAFCIWFDTIFACGGNKLLEKVGKVARVEHATAIFSIWLSRHPEFLEGDENLKIMWNWHAAEELEHRSFAFDLFHALGGTHRSRLRWFHPFTDRFFSGLARQTISMLRRDKLLWRWSTWKSAATLLFGPHGLLREGMALWRAYKRPGFHPSQLDGEAGIQWLHDNASQFDVVGQVGNG